MSKILIKMPVRPHRQKVLTQDGQEVRLQQFANRKAADALRSAGEGVQGEQFTSSRDALMRDMVANPEAHNIKFMGERVPFEGQTLEESLSEPDVAGERAAIDSEFAGEAEADFALRQEELEQAMKEGTIPNESQEDIDADKKRFNPDKEAEHMKRIMTSRNVIMRDAWSVLKNITQPTSPEEEAMFQHLMSLTPEERMVLAMKRNNRFKNFEARFGEPRGQ
jgi:hypothetical protein